MSQTSLASPTGRTVSTAGQACRECRRRKGKCDSKLPVCSVCQKYNRHCLYDKHSRSALTRKHLTEVEERLERAEALLRTVFSEPELARILGQGLHKNHTSQENADVPLTTPGATSSFGDGSNVRAGVKRSDTDLESVLSNPQADDSSYQNPADHYQATNVVAHPSVPASAYEFPENTSIQYDGVPSAADDDFEWDEREALWTSFESGNKTSSVQGADAAALRKITDGMATLSANDSNTGFLGPVSGAALLNLISGHKSSNQRAGDIPGLGDERRHSVVDILEQQWTESASSGSWLVAQPILNRTFVDTLVDIYFAHYHPTFPILHEPTFRQHYATLGDRPKGIWHTLANLVAALGAFVSSNCPDVTDINLFNAMKSQLSIESLETGSLALVQAFAMAANYLQKRNRPNSGYNYGGVALRLAISLGLHKEFQGWETALVKKEIRRRVWWSLCVLDVGATITYGRPLNWPQAGVEARFPYNIHEMDLTVTSTSLPPELNETTLYSYVRTQSAYHLATIQIYNRLISSPLPSALELTTLDDKQIESWRHSLPSYYCDADLPLSDEHLLGHSISRCRFRIFRIMMYRPFLLRWAQDGFRALQSARPEDSATSRCLVAAEECVSILARFWATATHTRLSAWYVLYFLLQAVLIPVHCVRRNSSHSEASRWAAQVHTALGVINAMVEINPSALKCRDIILRLCGNSLSEAAQFQDQPTTGPPMFNPFPFDMSTVDLETSSVDSWVREVDTAVFEYNMYCDRLTNTTIPDMANFGAVGNVNQDYMNGRSFSVSHMGVENEPGGLDWDWSLSLMQ